MLVQSMWLVIYVCLPYDHALALTAVCFLSVITVGVFICMRCDRAMCLQQQHNVLPFNGSIYLFQAVKL